jgi:hypothetical protein
VSLGDPDYERAAAYAAQFGPLPPMAAEQEREVWRQAFLKQKMRADSNLRAWIAAVAILVATNLYWIVWAWSHT